MIAIQMQNHIRELQTERALASIEGLSNDSATLRAQLSGPQIG
jgi:hypothetical protein